MIDLLGFCANISESLKRHAQQRLSCGLPPHSAERLGLSGSDLIFPEAEPQEKVIKKN